MIKNYFKIAFRILMRNKIFSLINIAGLATGLAACILILLYIQYELSFDRYNKNADNIFRVTEHKQLPEKYNYATSPGALGPVLQSDFPEIENTTRLVQMSHYVSTSDNILVYFGTKQFYENRMYYADPSVFKIFLIPVQYGDANSGLLNPNTIFISSSVARKYIGANGQLDNLIGKTIRIGGSENYTITGIFKDFSTNAHIHPAFLASFSSLTTKKINTDWGSIVYTYVLLKDKSDALQIENQFPAIINKYMASSKKENVSFSLMPLLDIHLHSHLRREAEPQGDIKYIYLFGGIALLILVIACFNYINMATARSAKRAVETGVRKVIGASRGQLIKQYFFESFVLILFSLVVAIVLAKLLLPYFNQLTQLHISLSSGNSWWIMVLLVGVLCSVSLLSGLYPALLLSSFRPVQALKGKVISTSGIGLRRGLVVFQFVISVVLIIGAVILQLQMRYLQTHQPGTKDRQVILIRDRGYDLKSYASFKGELLKNPRIQSVTTTQFIPGRVHDAVGFGANDIEGFQSKVPPIPLFYGDEDFLKTFDIKLIEGRNFSKNNPFDVQHSILVNEAAVKMFGWKNPVGKYIWFKVANMIDGKLSFSRVQRHVIGVVNNFHYESLRNTVAPVIIQPVSNALLYIAVRAKDTNIAQTLAFVKNEWKVFASDEPLDYSFLQDDYAAMYRPDELLGNMFKDFAILAIIIACLGLFGLSAFFAEQRTKEIGIRKVMGASVGNILRMLSGETLKLVIISIVIAIPIGWWVMSKWLQGFAYRINMSWWIFAAASLFVIFIALITVGFQAIKAAVANPVDSLRTE